MKTKSKEVAVVESNLPSIDLSQYHAGNEEIIASEYVVPRLLLMQGMSEMVKERKAQLGDMVKSLDGEIVGDFKKPIDIIPLTFQNLWTLQEQQPGGKFENRGYEPMTAANVNQPQEFKDGDVNWKRLKTIALYALLPKDIEASMAAEKEAEEKGEFPDISKSLTPVLITFRSTSYKSGKLINNIFSHTKSKNLPAYAATVQLGCVEESNDKGSWYIFTLGKMTNTKKEYFQEASTWYGRITSGQVKATSENEAEPF